MNNQSARIIKFIAERGYRRSVLIDTPPTVPIALFQRQKEMLEYVFDIDTPLGVIFKTRDVGASTVLAAAAVTYCAENPNSRIGFSGRGVTLNLIEPACTFILHAGLHAQVDNRLGHIVFGNGSVIYTEDTDAIGKDESSCDFYIVDEAFFTRQRAALPNVRRTILCSSGWREPLVDDTFRFSYKDDPRKGDAWLENMTRHAHPGEII